jgi:deoxyinosine 3'endonuclease (endonuclease V)
MTASRTNNKIDMSLSFTTHKLDAKDEEKRFLQSRKELWNVEQSVVAGLVQVEPDPPIDTSVIDENPFFQFIQDDQLNDIYSFSAGPEYYGGVDVSFPTTSHQGQSAGDAIDTMNHPAVAVYVIIDKWTMKTVYQDHEFFMLDVPYISTYLAFREIQPLQNLVHRQVQCRPDLTPRAILVDGNGILHPRNAGIACFLGTRLNLPTIGIGKSLLYEGGWTREYVSEQVDSFLKGLWDCIQQNLTTVGQPLQRHRGLLYRRIESTNGVLSNGKCHTRHCDKSLTIEDDKDIVKSERHRFLQELAPYCNGIAIPLVDLEGSNSTTGNRDESNKKRFPILGAALIGQGGQIAACSKSHPIAGSSKAIFVSVGHQISLSKAIQITASLCLARIPEPVRRADLYGRELMRQMKQKQQHNTRRT